MINISFKFILSSPNVFYLYISQYVFKNSLFFYSLYFDAFNCLAVLFYLTF